MLREEHRVHFNTDMIPQRRLGHAGEIADAVLFLTSSRATFVNGAIRKLTV